MIPDLTTPPSGPDGPWDPARRLLLAQATYCYRRALELDPGEVGALISLHDSFKARRMHDARATGGRADARGSIQPAGRYLAHGRDQSGRPSPLPVWRDRDGLTRALADLLRTGRPEAAVTLFASAGERRSVPIVAGQRQRGDGSTSARPTGGRPPDLGASRRSPFTGRAAGPAGHSCPGRSRLPGSRARISGRDSSSTPGWGKPGSACACSPPSSVTQRGAITAARAALQCHHDPAQYAFMSGIEALARPYADLPAAAPPGK